MTESGTEHGPDTTVQPLPAEGLLGVDPSLVRNAIVALDASDGNAVRDIITELHPATAANLVAVLRAPLRAQLVDHVGPDFNPLILCELDETVRDEVVEQLGTDSIAKAINELDSDDAFNLISSLAEERQRRVLRAIPTALRTVLEEGFAFPEDSAGRLMQREFVAVPAFWTVGEVIDHLRESEDLPDDFYDLFVVDPRHRLVGTVALNRILRTQRAVPVREIMVPELVTVPLNMDQEEVAYVFAQQDLLSAPVVDEADRLIGVVTIDDIVDVIHEEAEEGHHASRGCPGGRPL